MTTTPNTNAYADPVRGQAGRPAVEFFPAGNDGGVNLHAIVIDQTTAQRREVELRFDGYATHHLLARMTRLMPDHPTGPWEIVDDLVRWLDAENGHGAQETAARLLKLTEEVGEVAAAYIGATGQNPRKGTTHTDGDVADELCDVIVTAMVALHRFTANPQAHLAAKLAHVQRRMREARGETRCVCDDFGEGPCPAHPDPGNPYDQPVALDDLGVHYGLPVGVWGEDGDVATLGHVPERAAIAAANRAWRVVWGERLRPFEHARLPKVSHLWALFGRDTVQVVAEGTPGALAVTVVCGQEGTTELITERRTA